MEYSESLYVYIFILSAQLWYEASVNTAYY